MLPIVTIASKNYLAHVRTLAQSYLRLHPDGQVFVCLVDQIEGLFDPVQEPFTTILADSLPIPNWEHFSFKYTILEFNTAVKPFLLRYLFERYELDKLAYFDPDIVLYSPLDDLESLLDDYGLVLTPHILEPLNDTAKPSEIDLLQAGVYNLGFVGLSRRTDLTKLLEWWQDRLYNHCVRDVEHGYFVDQRWMDLAPALFPNVHVWLHPGCNVAYWNFAHRAVRSDGKKNLVQGVPLVFMHYSGLMVENLDAVSKHQNRFTLADLPVSTQALLRNYRKRLLKNGYEQVNKWLYAYGKFDNGVPIPDVAREMSRELPQAMPFNRNNFYEYLNAPAESDAKHPPQHPYLTQLAVYIYRKNGLLQSYLPQGLTTQRSRLMHWFYTEGYRYYQLDEAFLVLMRPTLGIETVGEAVAQQRELHGLAWKVRLKYFLKTVWGLARYERIRNALKRVLNSFKA